MYEILGTLHIHFIDSDHFLTVIHLTFDEVVVTNSVLLLFIKGRYHFSLTDFANCVAPLAHAIDLHVASSVICYSHCEVLDH